MLSDQELFDKYGKFCGYMAWQFTKKSNLFGTEDAEDFASTATISLLKCPTEHRHEPQYIKRLIVNSIIKSWRKSLRRKENEVEGPSLLSGYGEIPTVSGTIALDEPEGRFTRDWFDTLPGPNGLHHGVQDKIDYQTIIALLPKLPDAERLVIQLHFGLNGSRACGERVIAKKLGRTRDWAASRLRRGLDRVREEIGVHA